MTAHCLCCGQPFEPREGGKPQRFCRPAHRRAFDMAARAYVAWAIESGRLRRTDLLSFAQNQRGVAPDGQVGSGGTPVQPRTVESVSAKASALNMALDVDYWDDEDFIEYGLPVILTDLERLAKGGAA